MILAILLGRQVEAAAAFVNGLEDTKRNSISTGDEPKLYSKQPPTSSANQAAVAASETQVDAPRAVRSRRNR